MATKTIFAIDIGSATLKALVADVNLRKEALAIVAKVEVPSAGIKRGVIEDVDEAVRSFGTLLDEVEAIIERELKEAVVTVGGPQLETRFAKGTVVVSRADEEIGREDVQRAIQAIQTTALPQNRVLLHVIPRIYLIDEKDRVKDPVGMQGTRLSAEALLIEVLAHQVRNINKCLGVVGLSPTLMVASVLAGSRATIPKKESDLGVCAIDLGAETTSLAVFEDGDLIHTAIIPVGSRHISGDLATALKINFDLADKVKVQAGHALASHVSKKEMVALADFLEGEEEKISRRYLADVVEARLSEIFDLVAEELKKINRYAKLPGGAVLFGGGAKIPGVETLARRTLRLPARLATLDHYRKLFPEGLEIQFYPACGLLLWSLDSLFGNRRDGGGALSSVKKFFRVFLP